MIEHYLPNKNERATVAPKSNFLQLNKGIVQNLSRKESRWLCLATVVLRASKSQALHLPLPPPQWWVLNEGCVFVHLHGLQ